MRGQMCPHFIARAFNMALPRITCAVRARFVPAAEAERRTGFADRFEAAMEG